MNGWRISTTADCAYEFLVGGLEDRSLDREALAWVPHFKAERAFLFLERGVQGLFDCELREAIGLCRSMELHGREERLAAFL